MSAEVKCQRCGVVFKAKRSDALWCPECGKVRDKERARSYESRHKDICPRCGGPMLRRAEYCITCSNIVRGEKRRGANNGYWRGGKTRANGYVYVRVSPEPGGAGGPYKAEHHIVWEEAHGLPLPDGWVIHHLNGIKDDNRPENLAAMPRNFHNPRLQFEPYQVRIHQLEAEVDELRKQIGTEL